MTLRDVVAELSCEVLRGTDEELDTEVATAASGDLMSDILARVGTPDVLLTGLSTAQMIRTCSVAGIKSVVVVRGKPVADSLTELAQEEEVLVMRTDLTMFMASGRLFAKGMRDTKGAD